VKTLWGEVREFAERKTKLRLAAGGQTRNKKNEASVKAREPVAVHIRREDIDSAVVD